MPTSQPILALSLVIALSLMAFFTVLPSKTRAETLIFAADEWCPVNCEPGSAEPGYMVEIARAVLEPLGYKVTYQQINWARALIYARSGEYDGVFAGTPAEAPDFVFSSEPQGRYVIGLFVAADDPWTYEAPTSLSGRSAGLIIDYGYGEEIESALDAHAIRHYTGGAAPLEQNILTLAAGRFDMIVEDINTFHHKAAELGLTDRFRLEKTFTEDDLFIALTPVKTRSHDIAAALDTGMKRLRGTGELQAILKKYGVSDWGLKTTAPTDKTLIK